MNGYANVKVNQFLTLRENNRPRLIEQNDIADTTLSPAAPVFVRDLRAAPVLFEDRDGDRITFTATSSNPNIAQASMAGSILTVTLVDTVALGQARITVEADDGRVDDGRGNPDFTRFEINRAPLLRQALSDTSLLVDGPRLRINLDEKFVDPEGDLLEFQTGSRYDTVATAVVSDRNRLFIYQEGLGETIIHATALDNRGGKTRIDFGLKIIKSRAPEIVHQSITSGKVNQDIPIVAQIVDDENAVAFAALKFRLGGSSGLVSLLMDSVRGHNNLFRATIPGAAVTDRGVEYAIEATDIHRETSSTPNAGAFFSVRVRVPAGVSHTLPGGEEKSSYHLFSVPLDLDDKSPAAVLRDLLPLDIKKWRFYEFAADTASEAYSYIEYPNTDSLRPGKAFWLIVKNSININTGAGTTILTSERYPITLHRGWNFVGNPFNFEAVAEDTVSGTAALDFYTREFGKGWSDPQSTHAIVLQPLSGYAVYASTSRTLFINPHRFESGELLAKQKMEADERLWSIRILAQCQQAQDRNNVAAIVKSASQAWDVEDHPEPPVIGEYVSVYFRHRDWPTLAKTYCLDARPDPTAAGEIWEFEVKTNIRDKVNLSFEGIESVPEELEVWLVDEALKITQNLREQRQYAVAGTGSVAVAGVVAGAEAAKRLKLVVGKRDFVEEKLAALQLIPTSYELSQNFPNPFNPVTTIRYGLPKAESVTLKIYNLLGAEVATLVNDEPKAASYHVAIWDGRDNDGRVVASGVYVYRIQAGSFVMTKKMAVVK